MRRFAPINKNDGSIYNFWIDSFERTFFDG
jgi:hypothetical protein